MSFKPNKGKLQGEDKRDFDSTSLKYSMQSNWIARDYGAHFFRWGFAMRYIQGGERVLDLGCGADQALVRILCHHPGRQPKLLVGVDIDDIKKRWDIAWFELMAGFNFCAGAAKVRKKYGQFDVVTCFEVIEHMQKKHGRRLLTGARDCLKPGGRFLLSTPVFDGKRMAQNHIHEYFADELMKEIDRAGLKIMARYGTFQSALATKRMSPAHQQVWRELACYYSNDVMACFLAPLYPQLACNNLWVLTHK